MIRQHASEEAGLPTNFRILVTGSRDWRDRAAIWTMLDTLLARYDTVTVMQGLCPQGADKLALDWADTYRAEGAEPESYPALWNLYGPSAGPIRNGVMVAASPDYVLACAKPCRARKPRCPAGVHPSHGTADCVQQARAAGIPVKFAPGGLAW